VWGAAAVVPLILALLPRARAKRQEGGGGRTRLASGAQRPTPAPRRQPQPPRQPFHSPSERNTMEIPKDKILEMIKQQGKGDQVDQADKELPDHVDPERDSNLLEKFGLKPQDVLSKLGGGIPGL
jgi:hypothetical protein